MFRQRTKLAHRVPQNANSSSPGATPPPPNAPVSSNQWVDPQQQQPQYYHPNTMQQQPITNQQWGYTQTQQQQQTPTPQVQQPPPPTQQWSSNNDPWSWGQWDTVETNKQQSTVHPQFNQYQHFQQQQQYVPQKAPAMVQQQQQYLPQQPPPPPQQQQHQQQQDAWNWNQDDSSWNWGIEDSSSTPGTDQQLIPGDKQPTEEAMSASTTESWEKLGDSPKPEDIIDQQQNVENNEVIISNSDLLPKSASLVQAAVPPENIEQPDSKIDKNWKNVETINWEGNTPPRAASVETKHSQKHNLSCDAPPRANSHPPCETQMNEWQRNDPSPRNIESPQKANQQLRTEYLQQTNWIQEQSSQQQGLENWQNEQSVVEPTQNWSSELLSTVDQDPYNHWSDQTRPPIEQNWNAQQPANVSKQLPDRGEQNWNQQASKPAGKIEQPHVENRQIHSNKSLDELNESMDQNAVQNWHIEQTIEATEPVPVRVEQPLESPKSVENSPVPVRQQEQILVNEPRSMEQSIRQELVTGSPRLTEQNRQVDTPNRTVEQQPIMRATEIPSRVTQENWDSNEIRHGVGQDSWQGNQEIAPEPVSVSDRNQFLETGRLSTDVLPRRQTIPGECRRSPEQRVVTGTTQPDLPPPPQQRSETIGSDFRSRGVGTTRVNDNRINTANQIRPNTEGLQSSPPTVRSVLGSNTDINNVPTSRRLSPPPPTRPSLTGSAVDNSSQSSTTRSARSSSPQKTDELRRIPGTPSRNPDRVSAFTEVTPGSQGRLKNRTRGEGDFEDASDSSDETSGEFENVPSLETTQEAIDLSGVKENASPSPRERSKDRESNKKKKSNKNKQDDYIKKSRRRHRDSDDDSDSERAKYRDYSPDQRHRSARHRHHHHRRYDYDSRDEYYDDRYTRSRPSSRTGSEVHRDYRREEGNVRGKPPSGYYDDRYNRRGADPYYNRGYYNYREHTYDKVHKRREPVSYSATPYMQHPEYSPYTYGYFEELRRTNPAAYAEWYHHYFNSSQTGPGSINVTEGYPDEDKNSRGSGVHSGRSSINDELRYTSQRSRASPSVNSLREYISSPYNLASIKPHTPASLPPIYAHQYNYQAPTSNRQPTPAPRATPAKFHIPHYSGHISGQGKLIQVIPRNTVLIHDMSELLDSDYTLDEIRRFSGPLVRGTHKNSVINFCQSKIQRANTLSEYYDKDSYILLWKLLILLIRQNGNVIGADIAQLLLENYNDNDCPGSNEEITLSSTEVLNKFRQLLLYGDSKEALEWSMRNGLWGHALFLASKMDARTYANVMTRFANSLPFNDPLQTLYQLMSGRQPAAVTYAADEKFGDWRPHLAMILSNSSHQPELNTKVITALGDSLGARGCLHASHFCYLLAQIDFASHTEEPPPRLVLLGAPSTSDIDDLVTCHAIQCTEVYEYACRLANPEFYIPSFQAYKFIYAMKLVERGFATEGLLYCEEIANAILKTHSAGINPVLAEQVVNLSDLLKLSDPLCETTADFYASDPAWLQQLRQLEIPSPVDLSPNNYQEETPEEIQSNNEQQWQQYYQQQQWQNEQQLTAEEQNSSINKNEPPVSGANWLEKQQQDTGLNDNNQQTVSYLSPGEDKSNFNYWSQLNTESLNTVDSVVSNKHNAIVPLLMRKQKPIFTNSICERKIIFGDKSLVFGGTYPIDKPLTSRFQHKNHTFIIDKPVKNEPQSEASQQQQQQPTITLAGTRRQKTFSESSTGSGGKQLTKNKVDTKTMGTGQQPQQQGAGGSWLGGLFSKMTLKPKNQMKLPDDKNPTIVWDADKNRWINTDADADEQGASLKPPPKAHTPQMPMVTTPTTIATPPGLPGGAGYKLTSRGMRKNYVNVFQQNGTTSNVSNDSIFPTPVDSAPINYFVPSPVPTSDNEGTNSNQFMTPTSSPMQSDSDYPQQNSEDD